MKMSRILALISLISFGFCVEAKSEIVKYEYTGRNYTTFGGYTSIDSTTYTTSGKITGWLTFDTLSLSFDVNQWILDSKDVISYNFSSGPFNFSNENLGYNIFGSISFIDNEVIGWNFSGASEGYPYLHDPYYLYSTFYISGSMDNANGDDQAGTTFEYYAPGDAVPTILSISGESSIAGSWSSQILLSAIPEPAAWGMMLGGFTLIGISLRRQRTIALSLGQS